MEFIHPARRRAGISEVIGSLLTIAITLIAGVSVFGYVNSQGRIAEVQYAQAVGGTVSFLQEGFVAAELSFSSSSVSIYIYNNGQTNLKLVQIELYDSARSGMDIIYDASTATDLLHSGCTVSASTVESPNVLGTRSGSFNVNQGQVTSLQLTLPSQSMNSNCPASPTFVSGTSYYSKLLGQYGNTVVYYQVR